MAPPAEFETITIGDLAAEFHDGPHATPPPADEGPVYLGIKNLTESGHLDLSTVRQISPADFSRWTKRVTPRPDDLVFTYEATLHRYALIPRGFDGCLGRRLALIRPDPEVVDPKYLLFVMLGPEWRQTVEERVISGATVNRIPLKEFLSFPLRLPPIRVQRRIAALLSAFDELIEKNHKKIEILERLAQSTYKRWADRHDCLVPERSEVQGERPNPPRSVGCASDRGSGGTGAGQVIQEDRVGG